MAQSVTSAAYSARSAASSRLSGCDQKPRINAFSTAADRVEPEVGGVGGMIKF